MKNLPILLVAVCFLMPGLSWGQLWNKSFDKTINFIKMTEAGVAVVGTDDALYGLDKKGEVLWENGKLKKLEENRIELLSGSELIFVSDKGLLARNRVINVLNGTEYADRGVKGENIYGTRVIHGTNTLLTLPGQNRLEAWDINTNKSLWTIGPEIPHGITTYKSASLTMSFAGTQPIVYTSGKSE